MELSEFATEKYPIRCSSLVKLIQCPMQTALQMIEEVESSVGKAAQTGSVVHKGVETFHRTQNVEAGLAAMQQVLSQFPLADAKEAEKYYLPYTSDPRNAGVIPYLEIPVAFEYKGVYLIGTADQIRNVDGTLEVWDLKTGNFYDAYESLHHYAYQLAAYTLAASVTLQTKVECGGVIYAYGYRKRGAELPSPNGVFMPLCIDHETCYSLMDTVVGAVESIRRSEPELRPTAGCQFCYYQGLANCKSQAREKGLLYGKQSVDDNRGFRVVDTCSAGRPAGSGATDLRNSDIPEVETLRTTTISGLFGI